MTREWRLSVAKCLVVCAVMTMAISAGLYRSYWSIDAAVNRDIVPIDLSDRFALADEANSTANVSLAAASEPSAAVFESDQKIAPTPPPPLAADAKTSAKSTIDSPKLQLAAIMLTPDRKVAILEADDDHALQKVTIGQSIGLWQVVKIDTKSVELKSGETILRLPLRDSQPISELPSSRAGLAGASQQTDSRIVQ
jgi:hypothetical protein